MIKVFYVDLNRPWRTIKEVDATIVPCKKTVWAEDVKGARRLVGASVFFSLPSAERAKIGALVKLVKPQVQAFVPQVYQAAMKELAKYDAGYEAIARKQFVTRSR